MKATVEFSKRHRKIRTQTTIPRNKRSFMRANLSISLDAIKRRRKNVDADEPRGDLRHTAPALFPFRNVQLLKNEIRKSHFMFHFSDI